MAIHISLDADSQQDMVALFECMEKLTHPSMLVHYPPLTESKVKASDPVEAMTTEEQLSKFSTDINKIIDEVLKSRILHEPPGMHGPLMAFAQDLQCRFS